MNADATRGDAAGRDRVRPRVRLPPVLVVLVLGTACGAAAVEPLAAPVAAAEAVTAADRHPPGLVASRPTVVRKG